MKTDKRNQHYIPKFYLRNFSYKNNKKQIGVLNINNEVFFPHSKLKAQGSKNFYYGDDGTIEDNLSNIEGHLAELIKNIIDTKNLPKKESSDHFTLLTFAALTDLRNPVRIEGTKNMFSEMRKRILEVDPNADTDKLVPQVSHQEAIKMSLAQIHNVIFNIADLEYKVLINKTSVPFISSDFPVIKYNQYLELKKWPGSKTGYGLTGLQIFIPLNFDTMIVFFDSGIYKLGNKKQKYYEINNVSDVEQLNLLQYINCLETIYFDEKANESYIRRLLKNSKKFKRANIARSELTHLIETGDDEQEIVNSGQKSLMILGSTDCQTKLNISGLKIHSNGRSHKLHPSMAQLRPHPAKLMDTIGNY